MRSFGLIGYPLGHSFSKGYFENKFREEQITDASYDLFEISDITQISEVIKTPNLLGLNVTIPYKKQILDYLDDIDEKAERIGAVNVVRIRDGKLKGFNSDYYGFRKSLEEILVGRTPQALILGTGGASKAVQTVLQDMGLRYTLVSRTESENAISYDQVKDLSRYHLIINTTPLGMSPNVETCPDLDYDKIGNDHILYDLVYNPEETTYMKYGIAKGATVKNGLEMLHLQAEKSWEIWNS